MSSIPSSPVCGCALCRGLSALREGLSAASTTQTQTQAASVSGNAAIDSLLGLSEGQITYRWNFPDAVGSPRTAPAGTGNAVTLTYTFLNAAPSYYPNAAGSFQALNADQQAAVRAALGLWSEVANITFTETTDVAAAQMTFGTYVLIGFSGYAYYPNYSYTWNGDGTITGATPTDIAGDVWLTSTGDADDVTRGGFGFSLILHEIGHALGLKHPFDSQPTLPAGQDHVGYTQMSYTEAPNSGIVTVAGTEDGYFWRSDALYPATLGLYDIAATQYLYGANTTTRTGDDTYSWGVNERFLATIWDAGGTDTIDAGNQTLGSVINLTAGAFSSIAVRTTEAERRMELPSWATQAPTPDYDGTNNLAIALGVTIENAVGGSGNDRITGNDAANDLRGGAGADTLDGGAGNDALFGQEGDDSLSGGAGNDRLFGWTGNDALLGGEGDDELYGDDGNDTLDGGAGTDFVGIAAARAGFTLARAGDGTVTVTRTATGETDTLLNVEGLGFSDGFVPLVQGAVGSWRYGTPFADTIAGTDAADGLFGDAGADSLAGAGGNDYFHAVAGDGADTMDGGAGNDFAGYQAARAGHAIAMVDARTFTVTAPDGGVDTLIDLEAIGFTDAYVGLIVQRFDNPDGSTWNQGTYRADSIAGTAGIDGLRGGEGDDTLEGGAGRDYLEGEAGSDRLDGGAGNDYAWFGGVRAGFTLARAGDGTVTVTETATGAVDTLVGVEAVGFSDAPVVIVAAQRWDNADGSGWTDGSIFADSVAGTAFSDGMDGGAGNDTLLGGGANDWLSGGEGDDVIAGEAGNDFLIGGAGADVFRFTADSGFDRVADFDFAAGDRIGLAAGQSWGAFENPEGAWISFGPDAAVLLAGVSHTQVNAGWIVTA